MKLCLIFIAATCCMLLFPSKIYAANLSSPNYLLIDPEINSSSGTTSSANYKSLAVLGEGIGFGQVSSSLYKVGSGQGYTFMANVPKITCFETNSTSGTTECAGLPNGNGMVGECGEDGCYDRAMVQIDIQGNPTDTLFSVQVSSDDWVTIYVVDGTSRTLKPYSAKSILDYKTKSQWESSPWQRFNILGLIPNTSYKVRATALQGDFTESEPGPSKTATTSFPSVSFDLDIGADINSESNAPYTVSLGSLAPETATFQNTQRVKIDMATNAQNGISIYVKDQYTGLRSASTSFTLQSANEDLSNSASEEGFGIQATGTDQSASSLGFVVSDATYDLAGSNVGMVSSSSETRVGCTLLSSSGVCGVSTPTWVTGGKLLLTFGARATLNSPAVGDYEDALTFTVIGGW